MNRSLAIFFARLFSTEYKDTLMVRLGVNLALAQMGIVGPVARVVGAPPRSILGFLIESGVFVIDISLDSLREGSKLEEFKKEALAAYEKATEKVHNEEEKQKIREEYLAIISRIGVVGNGAK